jgi:hypothetical protein
MLTHGSVDVLIGQLVARQNFTWPRYCARDCRLLLFCRAEEFSALPSKTKVTNEKTPCERRQLKKNLFRNHPNNCFGSL